MKKKSTKADKSPPPVSKTKTSSAKSSKPARPAQQAGAPKVKKSKPKSIATTITAHIDVGFGNSLFLRGEGPGLSWDEGLLMVCVADDKWSASLPNATQPVICKFLINDLVWCSGDDFVVVPGSRVVFAPVF